MGEKCHFCEHERGPLVGQSEVCSTCRNFNNFQVKKRMSPRAFYEYEKIKKEEEWVNDQSVEFDRDTALMVLKAISSHMYLSHNIFGEKTLVINLNRFEAVRKKFLDGKRRTYEGVPKRRSL